MGCDCSNRSPDSSVRLDGTVRQRESITIPLSEYYYLVAAKDELEAIKNGTKETKTLLEVN